MTTPLDDIRTADDTAIQTVWRFGGYEAVFGPYPGRARALAIITGRDVLLDLTDPPAVDNVSDFDISPIYVTAELWDVVRIALHIMWSLAYVATGYVPGRLPHPIRITAPRACRTARRHPFRTVVRCTAPPARRVCSGRSVQDP